MRPGLITRKPLWVPTWRGWLILLVLGAGCLITGIHQMHAFLAVTQPTTSEVMVIEGWLPDFALQQAMDIFKSQNYRLMVVTGGPIETGHLLVKYKNFAELAATILEQLGMDRRVMVVIPAPPVIKDRTYASAVALNNWLTTSPRPIKTINLVTLGAHARRSRLLFEQALGPDVAVGIIALADPRYDQRHWWQSSMGVRLTTGEFIAYAYARLFFKPGPEALSRP